jgi:hypothetical protein
MPRRTWADHDVTQKVPATVIDMRDPLLEAWELVEDGLISEEDFRDFTFTNAVRLWGTQNPHFFEGTFVAREAATVLAERPLLDAAE